MHKTYPNYRPLKELSEIRGVSLPKMEGGHPIEKVLKLKTTEVFKFVKDSLKDRYNFVENGQNYLFCEPKIKNDSAVLFVAHIDIVGEKSTPKILKWLSPCVLTAEDSTLGADDRAGVYVLLEVGKTAKNTPYLLFTNFEETGGKGAIKFCEDFSHTGLPANICFLAEFDRQGVNEFVSYTYPTPDKVSALMGSVGYEEGAGSFSDVKILTEEFKIAHANISVGYYNQHTKGEYLVVSELEKAIQTAKILIETKFESPIKVSNYFNPSYAPYKDFGDFEDYDDDNTTGDDWEGSYQSGRITWSVTPATATEYAESEAVCRQCYRAVQKKDFYRVEVFEKKELISEECMCGECSKFFYNYFI